MSQCRGCDAEILWAVTMNGKRMPLDPDPDPDGNVRLTGHMITTERGAAPQCVVEAQDSLFPAGGERYMPHFVTCPNAEEFR